MEERASVDGVPAFAYESAVAVAAAVRAAKKSAGGTSIDKLRSMSAQARSALKREGYFTLEEVAALDDETLLAIKGFKGSSLKRLRAWAKDPLAPQAPSLSHTNEVRSRSAWSGRFWELYLMLRSNGVPPDEARRRAKEEVAALVAELRGAA